MEKYSDRLTEFALIVSLMGAGLKLDRPIGWRNWGSTWCLLGLAMPLTIAGIALLGWSILGLGLAAALLLGGALAPTDPVLVSDVQVGPPQSGEEDEVRFALTSEAGRLHAFAEQIERAGLAGSGAWRTRQLIYALTRPRSCYPLSRGRSLREPGQPKLQGLT